MSVIFAHFSDPTPSFWRSLQTLNVSRVIIALCLLFLLNLHSLRGVWIYTHVLAQDICLVYLLTSICFTLFKIFNRQHFAVQLLAQIAWDIFIISLIYIGSGGGKGGLSVLFLFPLAGVAILTPLLWAFFFCSIVSLLLLIEGAYRSFELNDGNIISQAGLFGASFFAVAYVVNRLASNLISQEKLATQRGNELAMQQAINRLVIADMGDGVLVLDHTGRLFEINRAAERMLGGNLTKDMIGIKLSNIVALRTLMEALSDMHTHQAENAIGLNEDNTTFVSIPCYVDDTKTMLKQSIESSSFGGRNERQQFVTHLKLRVMLVKDVNVSKRNESAGEYVILFMQDVSDIENQAQQLKLASMGRLTASIAHEVRNPLSAIGHATSLLAEDLNTPVHLRLLKIVGDNVARVNRMVEDILQLSRKAHSHGEPLALAQLVAELKSEFDEVHGLAGEVLDIGRVGAVSVRFDPLHLREVLLNLLGNAVRYASREPSSIRLFVVAASGRPLELHVQDDGPGISPEVRAHLFEPFYTTSSKGTGLGLYLARELCLNNEAMLDYEYRFDLATAGAGRSSSGRFVITFARPGAQ